MKKLLPALLLLCLSCTEEVTDRPTPVNLVPAEKMIPVIVDLQILESHFQRMYQRPDLYKKSLDSSSTVIFEKYGITRGAFDSSYIYYSQDITAISDIYEAALDSINFRLSQPSQ